MDGPGKLDPRDEARARALGLLEACERENREDLEHARRDAGRCRVMVEALALQLIAGEYVAAAATASQLSVWARSVGMRLETATARTLGLRAGRAAAKAGVVVPPQPPEQLP